MVWSAAGGRFGSRQVSDANVRRLPQASVSFVVARSWGTVLRSLEENPWVAGSMLSEPVREGRGWPPPGLLLRAPAEGMCVVMGDVIGGRFAAVGAVDPMDAVTIRLNGRVVGGVRAWEREFQLDTSMMTHGAIRGHASRALDASQACISLGLGKGASHQVGGEGSGGGGGLDAGAGGAHLRHGGDHGDGDGGDGAGADSGGVEGEAQADGPVVCVRLVSSAVDCAAAAAQAGHAHLETGARESESSPAQRHGRGGGGTGRDGSGSRHGAAGGASKPVQQHAGNDSDEASSVAAAGRRGAMGDARGRVLVVTWMPPVRHLTGMSERLWQVSHTHARAHTSLKNAWAHARAHTRMSERLWRV